MIAREIKKTFFILGKLFQIPDIRKKVFIILFLLFVFRLTANIPIPGIDLVKVKNFLAQNQFFGILNIFLGNTLSNFSVAMLGLGPYITAVIILQLLTLIFPQLKEMYYEGGEEGRAKFNQYARLLTFPLAMIQGYGFVTFLQTQGILKELSIWNILFDLVIIATGSVFLMWLGEIITEQKLGNGVSLLIFAGIISGVPNSLFLTLSTFTLEMLNSLILFFIFAILVIVFVVYFNEAERRIPISYVKRVRGMRIYGPGQTYLPLKVNQAGVIPIIFAIALLSFPQTLNFIFNALGIPFLSNITQALVSLLNNGFIFALLYFILVFGFSYFYTLITFEPYEISNNLQKNGAFIPGLRPGTETGDYLKKIVYRTTFAGGIFLAIIAVVPFLLQAITGLRFLTIGGTSVLIVVSVALETLKAIESQLEIREYEI